MEFNRPPEWGTRFQFPENVTLEYDGQAYTMANQLAAKMADKYDKFIVEQIAMEARAAGVSDLTVLNKAAIFEALERRTPRKPKRRAVSKSLDSPCCPACGADMIYHYQFCNHCGQAIDWRL